MGPSMPHTPPRSLFELWAEPPFWAHVKHPAASFLLRLARAAAWLYYRNEFREQQAGPDQTLTVGRICSVSPEPGGKTSWWETLSLQALVLAVVPRGAVPVVLVPAQLLHLLRPRCCQGHEAPDLFSSSKLGGQLSMKP